MDKMQARSMAMFRPEKFVLPESMNSRGKAVAAMAHGIRVLVRRSAGSSMCF
jgi:hypothetical protein